MIPGEGIHLLQYRKGKTSSGQADIGIIKFFVTRAKTQAGFFFDDYSREHLGYGELIIVGLVDTLSTPNPTMVAKPITKYDFEVLYHMSPAEARLDDEALAKLDLVHRCTTIPLNDKAVIRLFNLFFYRDGRWKTKYKWEPPIGIFSTHDLPVSEVGDGRKGGVIYLLKVGDWYKIGKTIDPVSRMRQLDIQLPEKAEKVHQIVTNDIDRVERHWHRYFGDKRANGEWFRLSDDDVAEFVAHKHIELG